MGQGYTGEENRQSAKEAWGIRKDVMAHPLPITERAHVLGSTVYSPLHFARILGITRQELLEKETQGIVPPAKRNSNHDRYYNPGDVVKDRTYLGLPSPVRTVRKQLFLNFKGGTGKSTLSASYGFRMAQKGVRTLLIDLDPQGHLTQCLGLNNQQYTKQLFSALIEKEAIEKIIVKTDLPTLDVIPSNLNLSPIELSLFSMNSREFRLKKLL